MLIFLCIQVTPDPMKFLALEPEAPAVGGSKNLKHLVAVVPLSDALDFLAYLALFHRLFLQPEHIL